MDGQPVVHDAITRVAAGERDAMRDFVEDLLPADARVSVYLFQPVEAPGLRAASPGALFDVGPIPAPLARTDRDLLYQCAEAGRTGSFLQSAEDCTQRVPQTTLIDRDAYDSYRAFNGDAAVRTAQIAVEAARHGFDPQTADGPPMGWHIHHLALAPSVHSFSAVHTGRIPVLGTVFTVTRQASPGALREYSNLVDYAIFIAEEALEIRATHLLGGGHLGPAFAGSALEKLLDDPACDEAVQLVVKLIFAHHWFFPYDPVAHPLLARALGDARGVASLYARHGWTPPRRCVAPAYDDATIHALVTDDLVTLIRHLGWYRLGKDFRPRPEQLADRVARALNTALLLLCGEPADVPLPRSTPTYMRRARTRYLAPPAALTDLGRTESVLAPVFSAPGVRQLVRTERSHGMLERFAQSFAVCGPGFTEGHARTHLKPSGFVESFERSGLPRFSSKRESGVRERTRWLCSYAVARLAESTMRDRAEHDQ